jgi:hypothetical protein
MQEAEALPTDVLRAEVKAALEWTLDMKLFRRIARENQSEIEAFGAKDPTPRARRETAMSKPTPHKRTGCGKPPNYLKMWADKSWSKRITKRLHVGIVDEELPFGREGGRKSWYIALTQDPDLLKKLGPVKGLPKNGTTMLLEDDVIALVQYLLDGLVEFDADGRVVNSAAVDWSEPEPISDADYLKALKEILPKRSAEARDPRR